MKLQHLTDEQIAQCAEALSNGNLSILPENLRQHIKNCDTCAQQVNFVTETLSELNELEIIATPKTKINFIFWGSIAATLVILIGMSFYFNSWRQKSQAIANMDKNNTIIKKVDRTDSPKTKKIIHNKKDQIAAADSDPPNFEVKPSLKKRETELLAYTPHPDLEKLVDRFSGSAMRGNDIKITTPILIQGKANSIVLNWENNAEQTLILEFFNNKGEKLFEEETSQSNFSPTKIKTKGLYYWKLINEDFDLLFCGKIKVL